jgi:aspartate/methionine/tyrosine aminotransferase
VPPDGGPFLFLDADGLPGGADAFCRLLLVEYGVPTNPGGPFGSDRHLRLAFGGELEDVSEAARRISAATKRLSGGT